MRQMVFEVYGMLEAKFCLITFLESSFRAFFLRSAFLLLWREWLFDSDEVTTMDELFLVGKPSSRRALTRLESNFFRILSP